MTLKPTDIHLSRYLIERSLWTIQYCLMRRYGVTVSEIEIAPLCHYVYSGRASAYFLHHLLAAKPYMIARKLHEGGSDDEIIARVKAYLRDHTGYSDE